MKILQGRKNSIVEVVPYFMAAMVAVGLKYHYSRAGSNELFWILRPTADVVGWMSGLPFVHDSSAGFVNAGRGIAIAPVCSGVNFMIISYVMSFFSFAGHYNRMERWLWLAVTLSCAYFLTIAVNSIRIFLSIESITHGIHLGWLTPERIHRIEGVVVYFFFLSLYYLGMKWLAEAHDARKEASGGSGQGGGKVVFIGMGPFFWYLLVALVVPMLTGNYREHGERFVEHGVMVVMSCALVLCVLHGIRRLLWPMAKARIGEACKP